MSLTQSGGNLAAFFNADGSERDFGYDSNHKLTNDTSVAQSGDGAALTGQTDVVTSWSYDSYGLLNSETDGTGTDVYADRGGSLIPEIATIAASCGAELNDVHISEPSLENLFLHHTRRSLRD